MQMQMRKRASGSISQGNCLIQTAAGIVIGTCLSMLGTPIIVTLLAAGTMGAYAFGWRIAITRHSDEEEGGQVIDI